MKKMNIIKIMGLFGATLAISACTHTISDHVKIDGTPRGDVYFPDMDDATQPEGIFPNLENLDKIGPGVTKKDLYYLIERPHFHEVNGAKEWDYIMKFRMADRSVKICQYKVLFDKDNIARSFYWKPANCLQEKFDLNADALFPFNRGGVSDIKPAGKAKLDELAKHLIDIGNKSKVHLIGYTDYIGSDSYNQALSQQRAISVGKYLVSRGVNANTITAEGRGESEPVRQCDDTGNKQALIQCLAPNRRVSVEINR